MMLLYVSMLEHKISFTYMVLQAAYADLVELCITDRAGVQPALTDFGLRT